MTSVYEKRRNALTSIAYFAVIIAIFFLFMKYAFWLFSPFIFAAAVAVILQKPVNAVHKKTHIKKGFISTVFLIAFLLIVLSLLSLIGYRLVAEVRGFAEYVIGRCNDLPDLILSLQRQAINLVRILPDSLETTAKGAISDFTDRCLVYANSGVELSELMRFMGVSFSNITEKISDSPIDISEIASPILSTAMQLPGMLVAFLIFVIASFFLTTGYDDLVNMLKNAMKNSTAQKASTVKRVTLSSLGKMAKAYAFIICITFCELTIGINILKLLGFYEGGYIAMIALFTALLDILPVFGTGTVMIPWALYNLLIAHNIGMGVGLLVTYGIITVLRQILEPKLVGANLGMPPILTLFGMYIGLETIGFLGVFTVPIVLVVVKLLNDDGVIHLWGEGKELATEQNLPQSKPLIRPAVQKITRTVHRKPQNK